MAVPAHVLLQYGLDTADVAPLVGGLINDTHLVTADDRQVVLQRLHTVFSAEVNEDIDAITRQLDIPCGWREAA